MSKNAPSRLTSCSSRASVLARSKRKPSTCISGDPVAQAIHDQLQHARLDHVQRVAAAGEIHVVALVWGEAVVGGVVDAAEGEGGTQFVALGGVVVDNIEDNFDTGGVQGADHRLELVDALSRRLFRGVRDVRGEESERVVAPVIGQPFLHKVPVVQVIMHRKQFDGGDAQA